MEEGTYTSAVDVWSFGCLCFWLQTHEAPFKGAQQLRRYCHGPDMFPSTLEESGISNEGLDLVKKCLLPAPETRFSAKEIMQSKWFMANESETRREPVITPVQWVPASEDRLCAVPDGASGHMTLNLDVVCDYLELRYCGSPTVLHEAAFRGDLATFSRLHQGGQSLNAATEDGRSCIHFAALGGSIAMLDHLCKLGEHIDARTLRGELPIHFGAQGGCIPMVVHLRDLGQSLESLSNEGHSLFHFAAKGQSTEMLAYVYSQVGQGVNITRSTNWGIEPIHSAAAGGNIAMLTDLMQKGSDVFAATDFGWNCLHFAASNGQISMINHLRSLGHDIFYKSFALGDSIMMAAARSGSVATLDYLRRLGLHVDTKNDQSITMLHVAARAGCIELFDHIQASGANLGARCHFGWTVLHFAARGGNAAMVQHLLELGQDINATGYKGATTLHLAARSGSIAVFDRIRRDVDLGVREEGGCTILNTAARSGNPKMLEHVMAVRQGMEFQTPLGWSLMHDAAASGDVAMLRRLGKLGLSLTLRDSTGQAPIHSAAACGSIAVFEFLCAKGEDKHTVDAFSRSPLHYAVRFGNAHMVKYLLRLGLKMKKSISRNNLSMVHDAAMSGNVRLLGYLQELGLDINETTNLGRTAFHYATGRSSMAMLEYLLGAMSKSLVSSFASDPQVMCHAVRSGTVTIVDRLRSLGHRIDTYLGPYIPPLLHAAAETGNIPVLRHLISLGLSPNQTYEGRTALHTAAMHGKCEMLKHLVSLGTDLNTLAEGKHIVHVAAMHERSDMLKCLRNLGCDLNMTVEKGPQAGETALHFAAHVGSREAVEYLLSQGLDPYQKSKAYWHKTPISKARQAGHKGLVVRMRDYSSKPRSKPPADSSRDHDAT